MAIVVSLLCDSPNPIPFNIPLVSLIQSHCSTLSIHFPRHFLLTTQNRSQQYSGNNIQLVLWYVVRTGANTKTYSRRRCSDFMFAKIFPLHFGGKRHTVMTFSIYFDCHNCLVRLTTISYIQQVKSFLFCFLFFWLAVINIFMTRRVSTNITHSVTVTILVLLLITPTVYSQPQVWTSWRIATSVSYKQPIHTVSIAKQYFVKIHEHGVL